MRLTQNFTLEELTFTQHRELNNEPTPDVVANLLTTAHRLERIRTLLGSPIHVNSGFRSPVVNAAVGGSKTSQHCKGEAVDFICPGYGSPAKICALLKSLTVDLGIDQLILEYADKGGGWVHCSFTDKPRHSLLTIDRSGTKVGIA